MNLVEEVHDRIRNAYNRGLEAGILIGRYETRSVRGWQVGVAFVIGALVGAVAVLYWMEATA